MLALDTNAYVAFKRGEAAAVDRIAVAESIVLSAIVIGELRAGFALGSRRVQNEAELARFLASSRVAIQTIDDRIATIYAAVFAQLRRDGASIPSNDLWIAASALALNGTLFTFDRHFRQIDGLQVVS